MTPAYDKRDENEPVIVAWLEAVGATVELLPGGSGRPDLLVGFRGQNYLLEVKTEKGKLSRGQKLWHMDWNGRRPAVVRNPQEAMQAIGLTPDC